MLQKSNLALKENSPYMGLFVIQTTPCPGILYLQLFGELRSVQMRILPQTLTTVFMQRIEKNK